MFIKLILKILSGPFSAAPINTDPSIRRHGEQMALIRKLMIIPNGKLITVQDEKRILICNPKY